MTWVKLDDHMADHPKFIRLGAMAPLALALQVRAMCYCARYLTDGRIPAEIMSQLTRGFESWACETGGVPGVIGIATTGDEYDWPKIMVEAGLWDKSRGDFVIHDYLSYNPSRASVLQEREANAKRQQKFRERNAPDNGGVTGDSRVTNNAPSPSPIKTTTSHPNNWVRELGSLWKAQYGGNPSYAVLGKHLKPLVDEHGLPEVQRRWLAYLRKTEGKFASAARFAQTFGTWGTKSKDNYLRPDQVA